LKPAAQELSKILWISRKSVQPQTTSTPSPRQEQNYFHKIKDFALKLNVYWRNNGCVDILEQSGLVASRLISIHNSLMCKRTTPRSREAQWKSRNLTSGRMSDDCLRVDRVSTGFCTRQVRRCFHAPALVPVISCEASSTVSPARTFPRYSPGL
jgi:hypothetical protein